MRFLKDEKLYRRAEHCLTYLRRLKLASEAASACPERFHFYWYGPFTRKQALAVKSLLATQDLARSELWLWLDAEQGYEGHAENPWLRPLLPFLKVQRYEPAAAAAGTPLAERPDLFVPEGLALRADAFRFITLYKHGGTYIDIDTMLLRDLRLVFQHFPGEFCNRWSAHLPYGNSAMLRLRAGSKTALALLQRCADVNSCHPKDSLRFAEQPHLDLVVLPCPFFDPLWPHADRKDNFENAPLKSFADFFRPFDDQFQPHPGVHTFRDFFPGALAYHWHNGWTALEHDDSYFGRFESQFDEILQSRLGIEFPAQAAMAG